MIGLLGGGRGSRGEGLGGPRRGGVFGCGPGIVLHGSQEGGAPVQGARGVAGGGAVLEGLGEYTRSDLAGFNEICRLREERGRGDDIIM